VDQLEEKKHRQSNPGPPAWALSHGLSQHPGLPSPALRTINNPIPKLVLKESAGLIRTWHIPNMDGALCPIFLHQAREPELLWQQEKTTFYTRYRSAQICTIIGTV
jgi:hypothetical protein